MMAAARKGQGDDDESSGDRTTLTLQSAAEPA